MDLVSIVVPVYQNERNLDDTIPKLLSLEQTIPNASLELVFVDDGSSDSSLAILKRYRAQHPDKLTVVSLTRNFGQTPAIQAGLRIARGAAVVIISADLQEPWQDISHMVSAWRNGSQFVIGHRIEREEGWLHQKLSNSYWTVIRKFAMKNFPKLGFDFCLLDRVAVDAACRLQENNTSIFPLLYWLGFQPTLIPVVRSLRRAGKSQWNLAKKIRLTFNVLIGFTHVPVRLVTSAAFTTAAASFAYFLFVITRWCLFGTTVEGWTSTVLVILFLGAMNLLAVGVLCEYLWRIFDEVRNRPPYVISRIDAASIDTRITTTAPFKDAKDASNF